MTGIIVGIDGSDHSRHALEWAIREATVRHAPLTVFTVQQAVVGYWGSPVLYPGDEDLAEQGRKTAQAETDSVLEEIGSGSGPSSVTVRAVTGLPAEALIEAAADADMLVVGSRGAGGFKLGHQL
jgi:nucleotide-binding universal stress UspA family protein